MENETTPFFSFALLGALAGTLVLAACSSPASSNSTCATDDDCRGKRVCIAGFCELPASDDGGTDGAVAMDLKVDLTSYPPACSDGKEDSFETDIDCGGGMCVGCADGKHCYYATDCIGGMCVTNVCRSSATQCADGVKDGKETDVDCGGGGMCQPCSVGKGCAMNSDCLSNKCTAMACVGTLPASPAFLATVTYQIDSGGVALTGGDINGDGKPDLISANSGSSNLSVLVGRGDGTFQPKNDLSTNYPPYGVVLGDFDGDGKKNLAVSLYSNNLGGILYGSGGGSFNPIATFATNASPRGLGAGDLDGDKKDDLAFGDEGASDVTTLVGFDDMGNATTTLHAPVGSRPHAMLMLDVSGDGKPDVITADAGGGDVNVLFSTGGGMLGNATSFRCNDTPSAIAAGDVNGDGKINLVVTNAGSGDVSVLFGNGDGTFPTGVNVPVGPNPQGVAVADFNSDGKLDIAVVLPNTGEVRVMVGFGNGTFAQPISFQGGAAPLAIVALDLNKDNRVDLAVVNDTSVGVLINITQ